MGNATTPMADWLQAKTAGDALDALITSDEPAIEKIYKAKVMLGLIQKNESLYEKKDTQKAHKRILREGKQRRGISKSKTTAKAHQDSMKFLDCVILANKSGTVKRLSPGTVLSYHHEPGLPTLPRPWKGATGRKAAVKSNSKRGNLTQAKVLKLHRAGLTTAQIHQACGVSERHINRLIEKKRISNSPFSVDREKI